MAPRPARRFRRAGLQSNCIRVLTPIVATAADVDEGFAILEACFDRATSR